MDELLTRRNGASIQVVEPRLHDAEGHELLISPPFISSMTSTANPSSLPYHYYEFAEMLLDAAADDIANPDETRSLLRDIREGRLAKMRKGFQAITDGSEIMRFDGVGAMELAESRQFIVGVMSGLRALTVNKQIEEDVEQDERDDAGEYEEDEDMV